MSQRPDKFTDRLFFALRPDAAALASIQAACERLRAEQGLLGQPLKAEDLHITLHHLGDFVRFPTALADKAMAAAATVAAPAFEITLDQAASFKRRTVKNQPCVLLAGGAGLAALKAFHGQLSAALKAVDLYRYASFTPHLTLLHDAIAVEQQPVEPIRWAADEFVLVNTRLGTAEHEVLGRWPLAQQ
ncbi:2'-5' RNA ligase family protein [Paucibacter sp. JuS9]|uniref:2'-5' RNA ligase family protein n=1 Tax=Roseateles TaxID=93681 RepID=UPI002FE58F72